MVEDWYMVCSMAEYENMMVVIIWSVSREISLILSVFSVDIYGQFDGTPLTGFDSSGKDG